jgi:uncharacterized protein (DUF697 family)
MSTDSNPDTHAPEAKVEAEPEHEARLERVNHAIQRNVYWAMGAGVLPLPLFDLVAITGVQLKLLRELSEIYDVRFSDGVAKKAVTSLLVGVGGVGIGGVIGMSFFKFLPIIGPSLGVVSIPVVSGMLTHAVGRTFVAHFEAGGTLADFDAKKMRTYFKQEYGMAKDVVENMKADGVAAQPT